MFWGVFFGENGMMFWFWVFDCDVVMLEIDGGEVVVMSLVDDGWFVVDVVVGVDVWYWFCFGDDLVVLDLVLCV